MRYRRFILALMVCAMGLIGCEGEPAGEPNAPERAAAAVLTTHAFEVEGMHCEGCVNAIRMSVVELAGVRSCAISLDANTCTVEVSDPQVATAEAIVTAIESKGFKASPIPAGGGRPGAGG